MSPDRSRPSSPPAAGAVADDDAPSFIQPQLATLVKAAPRGDDWLHELKLDGYRLLVVADGARTSLYSRNHKSWAHKLPSLQRELVGLSRRAVLDGEAVIFDEEGQPSFERFVNGVHHGREREVMLLAFDLLWLDGWDLRAVALEERKALLRELIERSSLARVRYLEHVVGDGARVFQAACDGGAEGIVSKRRSGRYHERRSPSWQKVKCTARQELVVIGWTPPTNPRDGLGALILGVHDEGRLRYAGRVGTGFSREERRQLRERLERLERKTPPLADKPKAPGLKEARWATPRLVAEIELSSWTRAGHVRHPSFLGLREDKAPEDVVRERPRG